MDIEIFTLNKDNKMNCFRLVLEYLLLDFLEKKRPSQNHFYHNIQQITNAFNNLNGIVAMGYDPENATVSPELLGYLIYDTYLGGIELRIIEVSEKHRKKGIATRMINTLTEKYSNKVVLTAGFLTSAKDFGTKLGFRHHPLYSIYGEPLSGDDVRSYKPLKPLLSPMGLQPDGTSGLVLGVSLKSHRIVIGDREAYKQNLVYFSIDPDDNGRLIPPLLSEYAAECYLVIYHNGERLQEGRAKDLFEKVTVRDGLLIMSTFHPKQKELFQTLSYLHTLTEPQALETRAVSFFPSGRAASPPTVNQCLADTEISPDRSIQATISSDRKRTRDKAPERPPKADHAREGGYDSDRREEDFIEIELPKSKRPRREEASAGPSSTL